MKRFRVVAGILCLILLCSMLAGCGKKQEAVEIEEVEALNIYATFYPLYALANMIVENVPDMNLHCLVQPQDGCLRDYQLSDWDAALLRSADAVIAGGRELESFETQLYALGEDGPAVSAVLYNMDLSSYGPEEIKEVSHWEGENPHIYMKIDGAIAIVERIAANLSILDPKYRDIYNQNLENAKNKLKSSKEANQTLVGNIKNAPVIVMNEALVYAAEEYGLKIELVIDRDSGEAYYDSDLEACIAQLSGSDALVILIEKQAPDGFCKALESAGYAVARLDVLSTHSEYEGSEGYFEAQRVNAEAIRTAFEAVGEAVS